MLLQCTLLIIGWWVNAAEMFLFFFSSRRRHTRLVSDWSSDVCSSDLPLPGAAGSARAPAGRADRRRARSLPAGSKAPGGCAGHLSVSDGRLAVAAGG